MEVVAAQQAMAEWRERMADGAAAPFGLDQVGAPQGRSVLAGRGRADTQTSGELGGAARVAQGPQHGRAGVAHENA